MAASAAPGQSSSFHSELEKKVTMASDDTVDRTLTVKLDNLSESEGGRATKILSRGPRENPSAATKEHCVTALQEKEDGVTELRERREL